MKWNAIYLFLLVEILAVAYLDFRTRRIANAWSIFNVSLALLFLLFLSPLYAWSWSLLIWPLILLVVGFVLFRFRIMGGGDAKFMSTFFLLIPLSRQQDAILLLLYSTIIVGFCFLVYNFSKRARIILGGLWTRDWKTVWHSFGSRVAYAPVVLLMWLWLGFVEKIWAN